MKKNLLLAIAMIAVANVFSQTIGDYRTTATVTGLGSTTGWQVYDGAGWQSAIMTPQGNGVSGNGGITQSAKTTNASNTIVLVATNKIIRAGQYVSGTGITSGTTVSSVTSVLSTTGNVTSGNNTVTNVASITGISNGMIISGAGIPPSTTVSSTSGSGPYTITMSTTANGSITGTAITINPQVVLSATATSTATNTLTFTDSYLVSCGLTNSSTAVTLTNANTLLTSGMAVTGTSIPTGTTISNLTASGFTLSAAFTGLTGSVNLTFYTPQATASFTSGSNTITLASANSLVAVGMEVTATSSIVAGTYITSVSGTTVGISTPTTSGQSSGVGIVFGYNVIPNMYINHSVPTSSTGANNTRQSTIGNVYVNDQNSSNAGTGATYTNATFSIGGITAGCDFQCSTVTVAASAKLSTTNSGTVSVSTFEIYGGVGGNVITNNGAIDLSTGTGGSAVTNITFIIPGSSSVSGTGTCTFNKITVNMCGTASYTIDFQLAFTMLDASIANTPSLTLTSGTFKISGTSTVNIIPFSGNCTSLLNAIPTLAGLYLNNPNATIGWGTADATAATAGMQVRGILTIANGSLTIKARYDGNGAGTLNMSGGSLNIPSGFTITNASAAMFHVGGSHVVNITGGTINIANYNTGAYGNPDLYFAASSWVFSGGTLNVTTNGTVALNASGKSIYNLTVGDGTNTSILTPSSDLTVSGNLAIADKGTLSHGAFNLTVTGTTSIGASSGSGTSGTLTLSNATGTKTFSGLINVYANGTFNNSGNSAVTLNGANGGIANSGTFTAGSGVYTFSTATPQALSGTLSIPSITVTSPTVLTNTNTLTVSTALTGSGGVTQASNATLNIGGTSTITTLTATASGNTVNFNGAGAQTIPAFNYNHLTISGTRSNNINVTLASSGTIGVAGNFTHSATYSGTGVLTNNSSTISFNGSAPQTVSISANLSLNNLMINQSTASTVSYASSSFAISVGGTLTLTSGAFITGNNTLTANTISGGSYTSSSNYAFVDGNLIRNLASTATTYSFPVGSSTASKFYLVQLRRSSATACNVTVSATSGNSGGTGTGITLSSNEYWTIKSDVAATTFTTLAVQTPDLGSFGNLVSSVTSLAATDYSRIGGSLSINSNTITATSPTLSLSANTTYYLAASSATYYWIGGTDLNWSTGNNWSFASNGSASGVAPSGSGDNVVFDKGSEVFVAIDANTAVNLVTITNNTDVNFAYAKQTTNATGLSNSSTGVTLSSTNALIATGQSVMVIGANGQINSRTVSAISGTSLTLSGNPATASSGATTLAFGTTNTFTANNLNITSGNVLFATGSVNINSGISFIGNSSINYAALTNANNFTLGNGSNTFSLTGTGTSAYFEGNTLSSYTVNLKNSTDSINVYFNPTSTSNIYGLTLTKGSVNLLTDLTMARIGFSATSGCDLRVGANKTLTINGTNSCTFTAAGGIIKANASGSKVVLKGTNSTLITPGANRLFDPSTDLNHLELAISQGYSFVPTTGTTLRVNNLTLTSGILDNRNNTVIVNANGVLTRSNNNAILYAKPQYGASASDKVSVTIAGTCNSGFELLPSVGKVGTLTIGGGITYTTSQSFVAALTLPNAGAGYSAGPSATVTAQNSGVSATITTPTLLNGAVSVFGLTNVGSGYTAVGSNLSMTAPSGQTAWSAGVSFTTTGNVRTNGGNVYYNTTTGTTAAGSGPVNTSGTALDGTGGVTWQFVTPTTAQYSYTVQTGTSLQADALVVNGTLNFANTTDSTTLSVANDVTVGGSGSISASNISQTVNHLLAINGNIINNGTINLTGGGSTKCVNVQLIGTSNQSLSGTPTQTTFGNLIVNNATSGGGVITLSIPASVAGNLTLTKGRVVTTATNTLTVTNTATTAISAVGTTASYIDGPLTITFATTNGNSYAFPIGKYAASTDNYLPFTVTAKATVASGTTVTVTATNSNANGTAGATVSSLSTSEFWTVQSSANSSLSFGLKTANIGSNTIIANTSGSSNGTYNTLGGALSGNSISASSTLSAVAATNYYFVTGTPGAFYWVGKASAAPYLWDDANNWSATSGGNGGDAGSAPLSGTAVYFDNQSLNVDSVALGSSVSLSSLNFNSCIVKIDTTASITTNSLSVSSSQISFGGSVNINSSLTFSGTNATITQNQLRYTGQGITLGSGGAFTLTGNSATNYFDATTVLGTSNGAIKFNTTTPITVYFNPNAVPTYGMVNVTIGTVTLGSDVKAARLNLASSNSQSLKLDNNVNFYITSGGSAVLGTAATAGSIDASATGSSVIISGSNTSIASGTGTSGNGRIFKNGGTINNLVYNSSGNTFVSYEPLIVKNLVLTAGTIDNTSKNITILNGGTLTRSAGTLSAAPIFGTASTDLIDVIYTNTNSISEDNELPTAPSPGKINNLSLNTSGTNTLTLTNDVTIKGNLSIAANKTLIAATYTINVAGNWVNNGTFTANTGTVNFNGTSTISGSSTNTFNNVTIATSSSLTAPASGTIIVGGDWTNNGTFTHNAGTVNFSTASTGRSISGNTTGSNQFNHVTFSNGGTWTTLPTNMDVAGNFTISNGTVTAPATTLKVAGNFVGSSAYFVHNSGTVNFNGTTTLTGGINFNNVTITGTFTGLASSTFNVAGNWVNNGTYNANSGTVNFNGTSTISGSSTTSFNNVAIAASSTLSAPASGTMLVAGGFTIANTGTFIHNNSTVDFNGTGGIQTIPAASYYNLTISGTRSANVALGSGTINVAGNYNRSATFNSGSVTSSGNTFTLNGTSSQTLSGSSALAFTNLTINNTNATVAANNDISVSGVLNIANGAYFDLQSNKLTSLGTTSGTGTLYTQNTSATPLPANKGYAFLVNYNNPTGGQTVVGGTGTNNGYNNGLTLSHTSGTDTTSASFRVSGLLTIQNAGATFDIKLNTLADTTTFNGSAGNGTLLIGGNSANSYQIPVNKTWTGTVRFYGTGGFANHRIAWGTYNNLDVDNGSTGGGMSWGINATDAGTYIINGTLSCVSRSFNVQQSTFRFAGTNQSIPASIKFFNLELGTGTTFPSGTTDSVSIAGSFTPGTVTSASQGIINFNGTTAQTIPAFNYNSLTIAGSTARTGDVTLATSGTIGVAGVLLHTATYSGGSNLVSVNSNVSFNGTSAQTIPTFSFGNLTINNAANVALGGAVTATGVLTFTAGNLSLGANNLIVGGVSGGSSSRFVVASGVGKLTINSVSNSATLFPIGTSASNYVPLTITNTSGTSNVTVGVSTAITNAVADATQVVNMQWSILGSVPTTATVVYQFNSANLPSGFVLSDPCQVGTYTTSYSLKSVGTVAGSGPYTVTATSLAIPATGNNFSVVGNAGNISATASSWTGSVSTDWGTANNWDNGLPDVTLDVTIPATSRMPVISSAQAVKSLTVAANATITNNSTLTIKTSFTNNGIITGTGTTTLVGTTAQTITGTGTVANFTLNNSAGATISNTGTNKLNVTGILTVTSGILATTTNGNLTLKSTSITNTAVVATGGISGSNITVERYIPMGLRAYRDISPGVTTAGTILANWQEGGLSQGAAPAGYGTYITGAVGSSAGQDANGFDYSYSGNKSLYQYVGGVWSAVANTNITLSYAQPYRILVRGDRRFNIFTTPQGGGDPRNGPGPMQSPTVLRATGTLFTGTYSPTLNATVSGFTMVANPYVCPINWNTVTKNNIGSSYWYLDPTIGNANKYVVYNTTVGGTNNPFYSDSSNYSSGAATGSQVNQYIQPGQAFFVKTTAASPSLTIQETDKASTTAKTAVFDVSEPISKIAIGLLKQSTTSTAYRNMDGAVVAFGNSFSNGLSDEDSRSLKSANDNLSIVSNNDSLSIEGRRPVTEKDTIALLATGLDKTLGYRLRIDASSYAGNGVAPYLYDSYKNTVTALNTNTVNTIDFAVDANAASSGQRFSLVFKPTVLAVNSIVVAAKATANGVQVNWNTVGEHGAISYEVERSTNGISFSKQSTVAAKNTATASYSFTDGKPASGDNYYRIKAIGTTGVNYSQVVLVKVGGITPSLVSVFPNPIVGSQLNVAFSNVAAGSYQVSLHNSVGQQVFAGVVKHAGGTANVAVNLGHYLPAGSYEVAISDAAGKVIYHTQLAATKK